MRNAFLIRRIYHLFQPLLCQVATAGLSPADIASANRGTLRPRRNTRVLFGNVIGIDIVDRDVLIGERRVAYDQLIIGPNPVLSRRDHYYRTSVSPYRRASVMSAPRMRK